jgi:uncharacterized protein (TIGR00255 family)
MLSMTGFGKRVYSDEKYELEIEIKTVNSRFLDLHIKMPYELNFMELKIKGLISSYIKRGKVDLYMNLQYKEAPKYNINKQKLAAYKGILADIHKQVGNQGDIPLDTVLAEDGIIEQKTEKDSEQLEIIILTAVEKALKEHRKVAENEGDSMQKYLSESAEKISSSLSEIENKFPEYKKKIYERLVENVDELLQEKLAEEDYRRILLETGVYVDKADVTEEIVRLQNHLQKFIACFSEKTVGKKLNFILQEMHRETNTIGSKFSTEETFEYILIMKEEIEKCREIVQNVQ